MVRSIYRKPNIRVEIDTWDWKTVQKSDVLSITNSVLRYTIGKTIKNPNGTCQVTVLPQLSDKHILDMIKPMDVIKVYEFGALKFIGYIVRVSYTGSITQDYRPHRESVITAIQFGGLLAESAIGLGFGTALGRPQGELSNAVQELAVTISKALMDERPYVDIIKIVIEKFKDTLITINVGGFVTYLSEYLDVESGLISKRNDLYPKQFDYFDGIEQRVTLWDVIDPLINAPFNELFIDNGPRRVFIDGKWIDITEKDTLIFRETPFDGTVGGISPTSFSDMGEGIHIDQSHLLRFDFTRSMDEVYSMYSVREAAFQMADNIRLLYSHGTRIDEDKANKYLLKPLIVDLFYSRNTNISETSLARTENERTSLETNAVETLQAWFSNNDQYLSGAISMMVPEDNDKDPKIGDKISMYGVEGFFYVEGISHSWTYKAALQSTLSITRGFNREEPIQLKDTLFNRNIYR